MFFFANYPSKYFSVILAGGFQYQYPVSSIWERRVSDLTCTVSCLNGRSTPEPARRCVSEAGSLNWRKTQLLEVVSFLSVEKGFRMVNIALGQGSQHLVWDGEIFTPNLIHCKR